MPHDGAYPSYRCDHACEHTACLPQQSVIIVLFMKQFVIDELRPMDYEKLKNYLDARFGAAALSGIYWMPIAPEILSDIQREHTECQPLYFALDLNPDRISVELLVRTKIRMRCSCMAYATEKQCNWLMGRVDAIFDQLEIECK